MLPSRSWCVWWHGSSQEASKGGMLGKGMGMGGKGMQTLFVCSTRCTAHIPVVT